MSGTWTLPDGSTQTDNRRVPKISFTPLLSYNNQTISFTGVNSAGSDTDTKTLTIGTPPTPQPGAIGGTFTLLALTSNTSKSYRLSGKTTNTVHRITSW